MEFFKINSKTLSKKPSSIEHSKEKIEKKDRTIDGTLVVDIIAVKEKITFSFNYLTAEDMSKLMSEVQNNTFSIIEYIGENGSLISKTMSYEGISFQTHYNSRLGVVLWKDVKLNFVER